MGSGGTSSMEQYLNALRCSAVNREGRVRAPPPLCETRRSMPCGRSFETGGPPGRTGPASPAYGPRSGRCSWRRRGRSGSRPPPGKQCAPTTDTSAGATTWARSGPRCAWSARSTPSSARTILGRRPGRFRRSVRGARKDRRSGRSGRRRGVMRAGVGRGGPVSRAFPPYASTVTLRRSHSPFGDQALLGCPARNSPPVPSIGDGLPYINIALYSTLWNLTQ